MAFCANQWLVGVDAHLQIPFFNALSRLTHDADYARTSAGMAWLVLGMVTLPVSCVAARAHCVRSDGERACVVCAWVETVCAACFYYCREVRLLPVLLRGGCVTCG